MSSGDELVEIVSESGVRVYYKQERGSSALIIYSDGQYNLPNALGAVRQASQRISRSARVRYRPAQGKESASIILEYRGGLSDDQSLTFANAFVQAVIRGD